ncbi:Mitochondrial import inner membrane translocase subunit TIM44-2 [Linum perenne]
MAARKLVRDLLLARQPVLQQFKSPQGLSTTSRLLVDNRWSSYRRFGVFNNVKEEANRNPELKKSVKELKEKAEELKGVKEDLKVSSSVKEKISAATEEQESSEPTGTSSKGGPDSKENTNSAGEETNQSSQTNESDETLFGKFKSRIPSLKVSSAFQRFKDAKVTEIMKKGYDIVKDELTVTAPVIPSFKKQTLHHLSKKYVDVIRISFSLPDFVAEVQDAIRPVLHAYMKGDTETLKKYCSPEVISRCEGEHKAFKSHGMFFDNRLLHVSEVEVRETKMMGTSPIIIVAFQTQQIHCVRDSAGKITEGGQDTIHTVYYAWAMQQVEPQELGEGAIYPIWRLREMQQIGVQALI